MRVAVYHNNSDIRLEERPVPSIGPGEILVRIAASGVRYVFEPGGSVRDSEVIAAANEYGMTVIFTGVRLFHH